MDTPASLPAVPGRVSVDGKHLLLDGRPFRVRGATYGTFAARADGALFPPSARVREDFEAMARANLNTVRTYTVPPADVVELAEEHGLRFIVGLSYDDWRMEHQPGRAAHRRVLDAGLRAVDEAGAIAGRSSVIAISVGNEVPADILRVHGAAAAERVLGALVDAVHALDAGVLATYTSFPTTEFLRVDGQDVVSFNVFLEQRDRLRAYIRRLMVLAGEAPLIMTEVGLAAGIHGEEAQAESLDWQLREIDDAGAAGATVFAWTDDWIVAGEGVGGWGFGLTDADRLPKPALDVVARWAATDVRGQRERWPSVTAVVCVRNGEPYIGECLASLAQSDYPGLEVVVCDDGSDDDTVAIASGFPFRLLRLEPGGLSRARNAGAAAATGDIVAFIDADARCHPHWPYFLALSFEDDGVAATGGPNLPCPEAGLIERSVAASPGNPTEVLVGHDRAEHVPGCNMAVRRQVLTEIGGFDPVYTAAGDDVDVCWRLLDRGARIGFAPAAQVWHHRRATIRAFLRQQAGYGRAEALLAARHRHRFNHLGQARWSGFVYGGVALLESVLRPVVYHGPSGMAPFQPVVRRRAESAHAWVQSRLPVAAATLPVGLLAAASPWWLAVPGMVVLLALAHVLATAVGVRRRHDEARPLAFRALVALLHILQPLVRAGARALHGLRGDRAADVPAPSPWQGDRAAWLAALDRELAARRCTILSGGPHADWDLNVSRGPLVRARISTAVAWGWEPLAAVRLRLRAPAFAIAGAGVALALARPLPALVLLSLLVAALGLEWERLRRVVLAALTRTSGHLGALTTSPAGGADSRPRRDARMGPALDRVGAPALNDVREETA
jgi:O-antigen biosynthesis protein